ncbi:MAG: DUF2799 domain-containing protein [Pseudomonadales bacterium]|nr:DUF2799 domain-containing protein [Pseudomonadales bacterium]
MSLRAFPQTLLICCAIPAVSGCAAVPVEQCAGQNWYQRGYADAAAGASTGRFLDYHNGCTLHGITPGRTSYLAGWTDARAAATP